MKVVVVGSYSLSELEVEPLVDKLMLGLTEKYPKLIVVAMDCDRGVGKLLKNMCLPPDIKGSKPRFTLEELALRLYSSGPDITSAEKMAVRKALNAFLVEVGEEFHVFQGTEGDYGMIGDLIGRLRESGSLAAVYRPGDKEVKSPEVFKP